LSPKSRAGASKDEPRSTKRRATAAKPETPSTKGRAGAAKDEASAEQRSDGSAGERIRTLDFSQPTKFTTEIRRRIAGAIDRFCEALAGQLTSELRTDVEFSVTRVDQHTWAAAKAQLAADAIAVAVDASSIERQMLLSVEQHLLLQALECLLGGQAAQAPAQRHLTDIDWKLARGLLEGVVAELSAAWGEIGGPQLSCGEVDLEADAGVLSPVGEPTFSVTIASAIDGQSSAMSLLIPWAAIEPVAESIRGVAGQPLVADVHGPDALRRGLAGAQVLLRTEVGSAQMPIERMLELVPGALVQLQERAEDGVSLGTLRAGRFYAASSCASGLSWAEHTSRSEVRWTSCQVQLWSSIKPPRRRSSCLSTDCASPTAAWSSRPTVAGACRSPGWSSAGPAHLLDGLRIANAELCIGTCVGPLGGSGSRSLRPVDVSPACS
jgi:flagellar motor switch protein FliM